MSIWRTRPVITQPTLSIQHWAVVELPDKNRHFIGFCIENQEGRVSSEIEALDPETMVAVTGSGRTYRLIGPPGLNSDAIYVWNVWRQGYGIAEYADLSNDVWQAHMLSTTVFEQHSSVKKLQG